MTEVEKVLAELAELQLRFEAALQAESLSLQGEYTASKVAALDAAVQAGEVQRNSKQAFTKLRLRARDKGASFELAWYLANRRGGRWVYKYLKRGKAHGYPTPALLRHAKAYERAATVAAEERARPLREQWAMATELRSWLRRMRTVLARQAAVQATLPDRPLGTTPKAAVGEETLTVRPLGEPEPWRTETPPTNAAALGEPAAAPPGAGAVEVDDGQVRITPLGG